jgi:DNA-binding transcriptional MerR regulator/methylmalonyl-CoA mutase cobalamin-binding subunit
VVAQRTGLSPHVLRAWERRYGVVEPGRSEGGQRLYSDGDIARLRLLHQLAEAGHGIGQLARLPLDQLTRLAEQEPIAQREATPPAAGSADQLIEEALEAVGDLDLPRLQGLMDRAVVSRGVPVFLDELVAPLLREIGQRWREGRFTVAQEHLATAALRRILGSVMRTFEVSGQAPSIVVATPPRQIHELGAMLVAAAAAAEGWGVTYLGSDLPIAEIVTTARHSRARAVALSLIYPGDDAELAADLARMRHDLPEGIDLLVGGGSAESYRDRVAQPGVRFITDLPALRSTLRSLAPAR